MYGTQYLVTIQETEYTSPKGKVYTYDVWKRTTSKIHWPLLIGNAVEVHF